MASASAACHLGLLHMAEISSPLDGMDFTRDASRCIGALTPWRNPDLFSRRVPLGSVASHVVVTTDASTHGWGAVCEGMPASGLWSSWFGRYGTATGEQRWICSPRARMHTAHCSSPCLTPRWKGTRWHRAGQHPGCMHFLRSRYCQWCYARSGRSEHQWTHRPELAEPALVPRPDRAAGGTALADPHQEGYAIPGEWLGVAPEPRAMGAFMCGCFRVFRGAERLAVSHAWHAHGGTSTLYKTFVCLKMGSVCEMVRSGSYRPGYLHRLGYRPGYLHHLGCSEFSAVQAG